MLEELGIKHRVLIVSLLPTMIIAALLGVYFTSARLSDLEQSLKDHGTALSVQLASSSEYGVFARNTKILDKILENAAEDQDVMAITVYDKFGKELAQIGPKIDIKYNANRDKSPLTIINNTENNSLIFVAPIMLRDVIIEDFPDNINSPLRDASQSSINQKVIGWLNLEVGKESTIVKQYQTLFTSACILLFGLLVSGLFAKRLGKDVTSPILKLTDAVEKIKNGKYSTRVYTCASGELKILESGINSMANSLKVAHSEMQNNIDEATLELRQTLETIEIQNAELDIARKEALTASKVKSEFLANMSHEIRTPMNGIIGFTQLLLKTNTDETQRDYLLTIQSSANSLLQIINDILDFSKIEAGKLDLNCHHFDILDCIEEAVHILAPLAHHKNLELVPIIYSDVPRIIYTDALRLKQIITNLVNNALKFTSSGSVVVRVMLDDYFNSKLNNVKIKVTVSDTGIGLNESERQRLFKAFSQADSTTARKYGGTGLGLVISKKLVQRMGGDIGFESISGEGSIFWFTFMARVEQLSDAKNSKNAKQKLPKYNKLPEEIWSKKIIICEKHPINRLSIKYLLMSWGIKQVQDIADISEFYNIINNTTTSNDIDLLLYGLNDFSDYKNEVTEIVDNLHSHKIDLGILANTNIYSIHKAIIHAGANFCLSKPVMHSKLYEVIKNFYTKNILLPTAYSSPEIAYEQLDKSTVDLNNIKILAVDDNLANLKLMAALLNNLNLSVTTVDSGLEAISQTKQQHFDLILMDIQMPHMDGITTTKNIKNYYTTTNKSTPPIIAVTAHAMRGEQQKLIKQGLDDYLSKPVNEQDLIKMLSKWLKISLIKQKPENANCRISYNNTSVDQSTLINPKKELRENNSVKIIDWQLSLKQANNNKDLAEELLTMLIKDLINNKSDINNSYNQQNYDDFYHHVHKLHGSCCYCGVPLLRQAAHELEKAIKTSKNFASYNQYLINLNNQIDSVILEYNQEFVV